MITSVLMFLFIVPISRSQYSGQHRTLSEISKENAKNEIERIRRLRQMLDDMETAIAKKDPTLMEKPVMRSKDIPPPLRLQNKKKVKRPKMKYAVRTTMPPPLHENKHVFTTFVRGVVQFLMNMRIADFGEVVRYLHESMKWYFSKSALKFDRIIHDPRLKLFMKNTLQEWKDTKPKRLKYEMKVYNRNQYTKNAFMKFSYSLDSIFTPQDEKVLMKLCQKMKRWGSKINLLHEVIDEVLQYFFDTKYDTLTFLHKTVLSSAVSYLAEYVNFYHEDKIDPEKVYVRRLARSKLANRRKAKRRGLLARRANTKKRSKYLHKIDNSIEKVLIDSAEKKTKLPGEIVISHNLQINVSNDMTTAKTETTQTRGVYLASKWTTNSNCRRNGRNEDILKAIEDDVRKKLRHNQMISVMPERSLLNYMALYRNFRRKI